MIHLSHSLAHADQRPWPPARSNENGHVRDVVPGKLGINGRMIAPLEGAQAGVMGALSPNLKIMMARAS